jgi:hypothetical protein
MFYRIVVDSWNDLLLLCDQITDKSSNWAFRGQSDESWRLSTKFEREAEKYVYGPDWFKNREKIILEDFQRRAHQYVHHLPDLEDYIEWLSLLQHYGGPTRLLDFTWSYYFAAFFAVETSHDVNSTIWAVNINRLIEQLSKIPDYSSIEKWGEFKITLKQNKHWADTVIKGRKNDDVIFIIDPFLQHERISIQQGLFLFPGNIEKPFEHNLCSMFEFDFKDLSTNALDAKFSETGALNFSDISIIKIVIPASLRLKALAELYNMNITAATLFPGLDGFARSLSFRIPQLDFLLNRKG